MAKGPGFPAAKRGVKKPTSKKPFPATGRGGKVKSGGPAKQVKANRGKAY